MRNQPKFEPEVSFLENKDIFSLQMLIDDIVESKTSADAKQEVIQNLESEWNQIRDKVVAEAKTNEAPLKDFLRFIRYNLQIMDKGGLHLGRSLIGQFISRKHQEMMLYFDQYLPEWSDI